MEIAAAAAGGGGHLLFLTKPLSSAANSRDTHQPSSWVVRTTHNLNPFFYTSFLLSASCHRVSPRLSCWDSNDEAGGGEEDARRVGRKPNRRRWRSDKPPYLEEEEEEPGILEEALDSFWIFKVFKSLGWTFPPIVLSWLLATGPKAFLMALALPLGQSALTFAFKKLWRATMSEPKSKARRRTRSYASRVNDARPEMDIQEPEKKVAAEGKKGYPSWTVKDNGAIPKDSPGILSFGGWDELDRMDTKHCGHEMSGHSPRAPSTGSKSSNRGRKSGIRSLLRLLVADFPFLGYLMKIL